MEPAQILGFCAQKCPEGKPGSIQEFRDTTHKELDKFLDKLTVVFEKDERPTVADLSDFMTECRQDFLGSCLQHLIEERYSAELSAESSPCPRCGETSTHRRVVRKKLETTQGPLELWRPWFYCANCHQGFAPLDTTAEISRREKQFDIQKRAVKVAAQVGRIPRFLQGEFEIVTAAFLGVKEAAASNSKIVQDKSENLE